MTRKSVKNILYKIRNAPDIDNYYTNKLLFFSGCLYNGLNVGESILDDDTTTVARVRREVFPSVTKRSDRNHVNRNFTSGLYKLRDKLPVLSTSSINYIKKSFSYATIQNLGKLTFSECFSTYYSHVSEPFL